MEDYSKELAQSASVSASVDTSFVDMAFSASVGRESFKQEVVDTESERVCLTSYCLKYHVGFNRGKHVKLNPVPSFEASVKDLPTIDLGKKYNTSASEAERLQAESKMNGKESIDL